MEFSKSNGRQLNKEDRSAIKTIQPSREDTNHLLISKLGGNSCPDLDMPSLVLKI